MEAGYSPVSRIAAASRKCQPPAWLSLLTDSYRLCTFRPITAGIFPSQVSVTERSLRGRPAAHHHDEFLSKRAR